MKWVTRERPKIDRFACPWLIRAYGALYAWCREARDERHGWSAAS